MKRPVILSGPSQYVVQHSHSEAIQALRFSPDGEHFFSASQDGSVRAWHTRSGSLVAVLAEGKGDLRTLDVSACGRWLLYASPNRGVTVLAWPSGEVVAELDDFPGGVMAACFSPDGEHIAIGQGRLWAKQRSLELWRWREPCRERVFFERRFEVVEGNLGQVGALAFSPDGRTLAAGVGVQLHVWGPDWNIAVPAHSLAVTALTWSSKGDFLLSAGCDHCVSLWRPGAQASEREWKISPFVSGSVKHLAIRSDSGKIAALCDDQIVLLDLSDSAEDADYPHYFSPTPYAIAYAPDAETWVVGLKENWQLWRGLMPLMASPTPLCAFAQVHMLADGTICALTHAGHVVHWGEGVEISPQPADADGYLDPILSPDGRWRLTSDICNLHVAPLITNLDHHDLQPVALPLTCRYIRSAFTRRWAVLVEASQHHLLIRMDPETLATEKAITGMTHVSALAAATEVDLVVLGDYDKNLVSLWEMDSMQRLAEFPFEHCIDTLFALSPDGKRLLAAANYAGDSQIHLLDPGSGAVLESFGTSPGSASGEAFEGFETSTFGLVVTIVFAADGERFATGHDDGRTLLWQIGETYAVAAWKGDGGWVHALAFSADGETLVCGGNTLRVRSTRDGAEQARLYLFEAGGWVVADASGKVSASPEATGRVVAVRDGVPCDADAGASDIARFDTKKAKLS